jgi:hypothetical protein
MVKPNFCVVNEQIAEKPLCQCHWKIWGLGFRQKSAYIPIRMPSFYGGGARRLTLPLRQLPIRLGQSKYCASRGGPFGFYEAVLDRSNRYTSCLKKKNFSPMPKPAKASNKAQKPTVNLFSRLAEGPEATASAENGESRPHGSGPPNRLNDLTYTEWMKFQKSFFRFADWPSHLSEFIAFFTKETWADGTYSSSLLLGFDVPRNTHFGGRKITNCPGADLSLIIERMREFNRKNIKFDFVFVDLRNLNSGQRLKQFLNESELCFGELRSLLVPGRYCGVAVDWPSDASPLPIPWMVANAGRERLRLRDEKIGLNSDGNRQHYCLFFQADNDSLRPTAWFPDETSVLPPHVQIPNWLMPKSPPRKADEIFHPAKFPEVLVQEFIELFSSAGDSVLDPMVGTGSALVAAVKSQRNAVGIELNPTFADIARRRAVTNAPRLLNFIPKVDLIQGDAREIDRLIPAGAVNYCITSPPYWSMLGNVGSEYQQGRRDKNLPTAYSESEADLGNIQSYAEFIEVLAGIYGKVASRMADRGYLTVIVKNVKRHHTVYPLAWDLVRALARRGSPYDFAGYTLWCQDDVNIKPFAVGIYWVSNTLHHYCLHFSLECVKPAIINRN